MVRCRSCGNAFDGNFCTSCGTPVAAAPMIYCPRCNSGVAPGTAYCAYCGTALQMSQNVVQTPPYAPPAQPPYPNQPAPPQQNNAGKYIIGALGGAAAVLGGEMLLHDVEKGIERHVERDVERREWAGQGPHHHHHHNQHHRRCMCGHEYGIEIEICPRCRRRWGSW